ncbi:hypothetical protein YC2023_076315 [Brassica napus]
MRALMLVHLMQSETLLNLQVTYTSTQPQQRNFISTQPYKPSQSSRPGINSLADRGEYFPCIDTKDGIKRRKLSP